MRILNLFPKLLEVVRETALFKAAKASKESHFFSTKAFMEKRLAVYLGSESYLIIIIFPNFVK